ncbi:DUF1593-domain-containing protein [Byssothecium circinans]|uniref:DUF1593-domain-containing protein n=1 Tax=Byssothecium circinans TaxID=147558 RepID=A0A6A5TZV8_9PLEO|nr:DUF1593-domain-containing protein [Byssothecium circinans]
MVDQRKLRFCATKPRIFVISDIANEPDDAQSLVRFLLYGNEFDIKGLVACTSAWMRSAVHPEQMKNIIEAYGQVVSNLNAHVHPENQYPDAQSLLQLLRTGPPVYGKRALDSDVPLSDGAALLIEQLTASEESLWILCWGGVNVLAQALQHIHKTKDPAVCAELRSRLRVYAISDQDDTGLWIRVQYPDIFFICSVHGWNNYALATWTGISGDIGGDFRDGGGPDTTLVSAPWLKKNIQVGPLGAVYPNSKFLMEGDTPTFLYLIQNGLGRPQNPEWGSWGGRYVPIDVSLSARHYADCADRVVGLDGRTYVSNQATIWRWREAYQNDFAARMQWTLSADVASVNHAPVPIVNGSKGPEPLLISIEASENVILDGSSSYDPNGNELKFSWFQYREPSTAWGDVIDPQLVKMDIKPVEDVKALPGSKVQFVLPGPEKCAIDFVTGKAQSKGQVLHIILEVKNNGSPCLYSYKRVVIHVTNEKLLGGRDRAFETVMDTLEV